jgi:hypothetical protein
MSHRKGLRLDGKPYTLSPSWYRSKLVEEGDDRGGRSDRRYECGYCYSKAYYLKNKEWIQSRQKRWREQRRKLMTKTLKSLAVIDKKNKLKKKTIKSKR